ncbi:MAG: acyl-[acyl-carrier-protein]--UDP-N-acetylglucosamine O-acyltransferase, partial [Candidatus Muirbacterium halophilum]|nr:acyl-[acyl-carrier-protein]--UDP-N-acetylglucosamine O-acyltransferase [Candidatus Muirbacterium halophilum]
MKNLIHERANISEGAQIGKGTEIGPNVYIGPNVIIGDNCRLLSNSYIDGDTVLGDNTEVYPSAVIGTITQAKDFSGGKSGVRIGKNNIIREFVTINATEGEVDEYTRIGDNNLIMAYSHVAHHCVLHNNIIMSNAVNLAGHVEVFSNAILGGLAA